MYSLADKEEMYALISRVLMVANKNPVMMKAAEYMGKLLPEAEYHLIYVIDTSQRGMALTKDMELASEEIGKNSIKDMEDILKTEGVRSVKSTITEGKPHERTLWYAHKSGIDLIILSTDIEPERKKPCLGRITKSILERTDIPAMVFTPYFKEGAPRQILNVNSGVNESFRATEIGLRLCRAIGAEMLTLYIGEEISSHRMDEMKRKAEGMGVRYSVKIVDGNPVDMVLKESEKADLLVMSRGIPSLRYRSLRKIYPGFSFDAAKREILKKSSIPVLLIPK